VVKRTYVVNLRNLSSTTTLLRSTLHLLYQLPRRYRSRGPLELDVESPFYEDTCFICSETDLSGNGTDPHAVKSRIAYSDSEGETP
jgi:flagellar motor component MotA